jgi:CheY-like chemotaxis protein/signal transduction histidine kinase
MPSIAPTSPIAPLTGNNSMLRGLLCWLLFLVATTGQAAPSLFLEPQHGSIDLSSYTDIIADPDKNYQIADFLDLNLNRQFRPTIAGDMQLAEGVKQYWFRFTLHNNSGEALHPLLQILPADDSATRLYHDQKLLPHFPSSALTRHQTLHTLPLPAHSSQIFYLAVEYPFARRISLELHDYASFLGKTNKQEFINTTLLGALALLVIFNAISALLHRDQLFAYQAIFCILTIGYYLLAFGYIGKTQGLLPPWNGSSLALAFIAVSFIELIYAMRFPIYPMNKPQGWLLAIRALMVAHCLAIVLTLINGGARDQSTAINSVFAITSLLLLAMSLYCYLQTYSKIIFYYMVIRIALVLSCGLTLFSFYLDLISSQTLTTLFLSIAAASAVSHTALLIARNYYRKQKRNNESQHIAILGEVSRAKTDILARITHDIRTPMSAMLGLIELLQETRMTATQEDHLRTLQRSSHELLQLMHEASQAAQFSESNVELSNQLINVPEIIGESLAGFRNLAAEQALELIFDIDDEVSEQLIGDPSRIRQLLTHVMNGAFEHHEKGYILLKVYPSSTKPGLLFFALSHHGKPYSPQEKKALNQSVARDVSIVNTRFAIVVQLVSLMQGQVNVRTTLNGTHSLSFSLLLGAPKSNDRTTPRSNELLANKRLLVVNSNHTFCKVIGKQCGNWGIQTFVAHSNNATIATIRNQALLKNPIEIVLIDHNEANSGLKLAKRIQSECGEQLPLPICLLLAHANIIFDRNELRSADVRRVLSKPLSSMALRTALLGECHYEASNRSHSPDQYSTDAFNLPSLHCLIAEDHPTNAHVLSRMLSSLGITVVHVENGQQAVNSFMRNRFDIIIMDIEMPIMDGVEATKQIRQFELEESRERTPIFGLTANALDEQRDNYLRAGMDLHLIKPIRLWEMAEAIKRWTGYQQPDKP